MGMPTMPPAPADPYNCADGFANWQAGWSVPKKEWCCRVHGKGCPGQQAGGCAPVGTTSAPYDCNAGFANWMAGWSVAKKAWCCQNAGKGAQQQQEGVLEVVLVGRLACIWALAYARHLPALEKCRLERLVGFGTGVHGMAAMLARAPSSGVGL